MGSPAVAVVDRKTGNMGAPDKLRKSDGMYGQNSVKREYCALRRY